MGLALLGNGSGYWKKVPGEIVYPLIQRHLGKTLPEEIAALSLLLDIEKEGRPKPIRFYERLWHWGWRRVKAFIEKSIGRLKAVYPKPLEPNSGIKPINKASSPEPNRIKPMVSSTNTKRQDSGYYSSPTLGKNAADISPYFSEDSNKEWEAWEEEQRKIKENPDLMKRLYQLASKKWWEK